MLMASYFVKLQAYNVSFLVAHREMHFVMYKCIHVDINSYSEGHKIANIILSILLKLLCF